ncbi:MAG: AAA family ATPase [Sciscionella sp.]
MTCPTGRHFVLTDDPADLAERTRAECTALCADDLAPRNGAPVGKRVHAYRWGSGQWVIHCPFCSWPHFHGIGNGEGGSRIPHCVWRDNRDKGSYTLVPVEGDPPAPLLDLIDNRQEDPASEGTAEDRSPGVVDDSGISATVVRLADVSAESVSWLWPGRLPAGKIVMLDGDPSLGKSTLALTFAAHVSTGRAWPDRAPCPLGDVVVLSAEDGLADTIRPRLDAAGGIAARVHAVTGIPAVTEDGTRYERPVTLADINPIAETVLRVRARLLIVDVLMAYLPTKVDSHRDQDVRSILAVLAQLGERTGCTVLLLRHLNKTGAGAAVYRGGGSIGIIGAARAGYVVAPDPDDEEQRVLACTKNNLAPMPPSLTYRLESAPGSHVARVVWGAESTHSAGDLLSTHNEESEDGDDIRGWLHAYLASNGGAAGPEDVMKAGRAAGYSPDQLKRAKKPKGTYPKVYSRKPGMAAGWVWSLEEDTDSEGSAKSAKGVAHTDPHSSRSSVLPSGDADQTSTDHTITNHPERTQP